MKKKLIISTYSKPTGTHQYLVPKSCHPSQQTKPIPYSVIHRVRRNASDRTHGDIVFKEQAKLYKAYLLKSGFSGEDIDEQFLKICKFKRSTLLYRKRKEERRKRDRIKLRFVTDYEPAFPSIKNTLKQMEGFIKNNQRLRKMLPDGARNVQVSFRRGGKNIKEILATTKLNYGEERATRIGKSKPCNTPCIHCHLLKNTEGSTFESFVTKRKYKIRQEIDCT